MGGRIWRTFFSLVRDRVTEGHEATERAVGHRGLDGLAVVLGDFRPEGLTVGCDLGEGARQESLGPVGGVLPVMISKSSGDTTGCLLIDLMCAERVLTVPVGVAVACQNRNDQAAVPVNRYADEAAFAVKFTVLPLAAL